MASDAPTTGAPTRAPSIDRRTMLTGAAAVPMLASFPTAAAPSGHSGSQIEALFAEWKAALWAFNHTPGLNDSAATVLWDRASAAEMAIIQSDGASPQLAAMRLWIGISHVMITADDLDAASSGDIAALTSRADEYDWEIQCAIHALRALVGTGGRA